MASPRMQRVALLTYSNTCFSESKIGYEITHGLGPFYNELLVKRLQNEFFSINIDESTVLKRVNWPSLYGISTGVTTKLCPNIIRQSTFKRRMLLPLWPCYTARSPPTILTTRNSSLPLKPTVVQPFFNRLVPKCVFLRGSAPNTAGGGAYSTPQTPSWKK